MIAKDRLREKDKKESSHRKQCKMRGLEDVRKVLAIYKGYIAREFKAQIVGIFGSYARGSQTPQSDIDILVRFREGASLFDLVGLADFLEEKLKTRVDVVSERAVRPELKEQILKEVVKV
jgi:hypothetical protein